MYTKTKVSRKPISIDKISAFLQVFKVVIPVTSSKVMAQNTQKAFDWVSNAEKIYLGSLCLIFYQKWTRLLNEIIVSSSNTIRSLATIRMTTMDIFFFYLTVQFASRARHNASHDLQFAGPLAKSTYNASFTLTEPLIVHNYNSIFLRNHSRTRKNLSFAWKLLTDRMFNSKFVCTNIDIASYTNLHFLY